MGNTAPGIFLYKINKPDKVIGSQEDGQGIGEFFTVEPFGKIFLLRNQLGGKYNNSKYCKSNYKRAQYMITETFIKIPFIKIYQRFGNAAAGAGKARKHFKWAEGLVGF